MNAGADFIYVSLMGSYFIKAHGMDVAANHGSAGQPYRCGGAIWEALREDYHKRSV